jgi:hypothetical protein
MVVVLGGMRQDSSGLCEGARRQWSWFSGEWGETAAVFVREHDSNGRGSRGNGKIKR